MSWLPEEEFEWVLDENDQLIAIFFTSIRTAKIHSGADIGKKESTSKPKDNNENDKAEN